jgi:hypothetical protein
MAIFYSPLVAQASVPIFISGNFILLIKPTFFITAQAACAN